MSLRPLRHAALAAAWMLAAAAPAALAHAPNPSAGQVPAVAPALEFDGRVLVRIAEPEAGALRGASARGLERMRAVSPTLRGLSATHRLRAATPVLADDLLHPAAREVGLDRWFVLEVDPAHGFPSVAARLRALYGVEFVDPDHAPVTLTVAPNDSLFSKNWGHGNTGTFPAFVLGPNTHTGANVGTVGFDANVQGGWGAPTGYGDSTVIVAILDTGVDPTHPDLKQVPGWDYFNFDSDPTDTHGHGTGCAGVAAGVANNTRGVAGSAGGVKIMPLRESDGSSYFPSGLAQALNFAVVNGADVASMSFTVGYIQIVADALTAADAAGVVLLAATGNSNLSTLPFPANHPKVIAVGAASPCAGRKRSSSNPAQVNPGVATDSLGVSCDNEVWWGSSWGVAVPNDSAAVDLVGPTMVPTTDIQGAGGFSATGYFDYFNGTSCATPYVAGVAALIRSQHPTWTPAQVRQRLIETAFDIADAQTPAGWDKYTGYGMVNAGLPDMFSYTPPSWASGITPRPAADATFGSVPAPATLNGDVNSFVNFAPGNIGESASGQSTAKVFTDGVESLSFPVNIPSFVYFGFINHALNVRGGRHVVGHVLDSPNEIAESNETNNREGHQWSWLPANVPTSASTVVSRLAPPDRLGGRADVPVSETTYDNVDAVRMVGPPLGFSNQFWLMGLHASDPATDLDLRLHSPTTTATDGFQPVNLLESSTYGNGITDWAIVHLGNYAAERFDAASLRFAGTGQSRFEARLSEGISNSFSGSTIVIPGTAFTSDMMLAVHDLFLFPGGPGPVTLELTSSAPLHLAIYDPATGLASRNDAMQFSTQVVGVERLSRTLALGRHPVVVYRDPTDGTGPLTYSITVRRTPAELVAAATFGAHAPSGVFKSGVGSIAAPPTVLDGNVTNTHFFYGYTNPGPTEATGFEARELIDGVNALTWTPGPVAAGGFAGWVSSFRNIRGGRHTLGFQNDITGAIAEFDETNNNHASQWVWSPLPLALEVPVTRPTPPDPFGGTIDLPVGPPVYINEDGLRTPVLAPSGNNGFWHFFAMTPRTGSHDADFAVWEPISTGPSDGFATPSEASGFLAGQTDLLGIDVDGAPRAVDLGVVNYFGSGDVVVHGAFSRFFGGDVGTIGPFTLGPDSLIALTEIQTTGGTARQVRLKNLSGNADLEMHIFERDSFAGLYNANNAIAYSNLYGDGGDEVIQVVFPGSLPAIVVNKRGSSDIGKTSTFEIEIGSSTVDAPEELPVPTAVRLAPVQPNPVRAFATIGFDLPREGAVDLTAYDVTGRRVATLASGSWPAGRHSVRWSPEGAAGAKLASGVYLLRLEAGGVRIVQRMVVTN